VLAEVSDACVAENPSAIYLFVWHSARHPAGKVGRCRPKPARIGQAQSGL